MATNILSSDVPLEPTVEMAWFLLISVYAEMAWFLLISVYTQGMFGTKQKLTEHRNCIYALQD